MILSLIESDQLGNARKALRRITVSENLTAELESMCASLARMKSLRLSPGKKQGSDKSEHPIDERLAHHVEAERTRLFFLTLSNERPQTSEQIERMGSQLTYPNDASVKKYLGDLFFLAGNRLKAGGLYSEVLKSKSRDLDSLVDDIESKGFFPGQKPTKTTLRILELLEEVDEACTTSGTSYLCAGDVPAIFLKKQFTNFNHLGVFVPAKHLEHICRSLADGQRDDRKVEHWEPDDNRFDIAIRYSDTESIDCNLVDLDTSRSWGLHVDIFPFHEKHETSRCLGLHRNRATFEIEPDLFAKMQRVQLAGFEFSLPCDIKKLAETLPPQTRKNTPLASFALTSTNVSYASLLAREENAPDDLETATSSRQRLVSLDAEINEEKATIDRFWNHIRDMVADEPQREKSAEDARKRRLDLAVELVETCRKNNIPVTVVSKCALAQERGQGIPTDCDAVDLLVTKAGFAKLDMILSQNLPQNRAWVTNKRYPDFPDLGGRFTDINSSYLTKDHSCNDFPMGLFTRVVVAEKPDKNDGRKDSTILRARWNGQSTSIREEWLDRLEIREFEDRALPFLNDNADYLNMNYGFSWNIIPKNTPKQSRDAIESASIPYLRCVEMLKLDPGFIDYQRALQLRNNKQQERRAVIKNAMGCIAKREIAFLNELAIKLEEHVWEFDLDNPKRHLEDFAEFARIAKRKELAGFPNSVAMRDDLRNTMLLTLIYANMIEQCKAVSRLLTNWDERDFYIHSCDLIAELLVCRACNDPERALMALDELENDQKIRFHREAEKTRLWLLARSSDQPKSEMEIKNACGQIRNRGDLEIELLIGNLYHQAGLLARAVNHYSKAGRSRNSLILKNLAENGVFYQENNDA